VDLLSDSIIRKAELELNVQLRWATVQDSYGPYGSALVVAYGFGL
jgi:hypothetical protein